MKPTPELMTPGQAAELLHTTEASLAQQRYHRTGPDYVRLGRKILYRRCDIDAYVAANVQTHATA